MCSHVEYARLDHLGRDLNTAQIRFMSSGFRWICNLSLQITNNVNLS